MEAVVHCMHPPNTNSTHMRMLDLRCLPMPFSLILLHLALPCALPCDLCLCSTEWHQVRHSPRAILSSARVVVRVLNHWRRGADKLHVGHRDV